MGNLEKLVSEIRAEFQIPPYFPDASLKAMIRESEMWLHMINPGCDPDADSVCRELLKNRVYYAFNHALNDFYNNYKDSIVSWQAETLVCTNSSQEADENA